MGAPVSGRKHVQAKGRLHRAIEGDETCSPPADTLARDPQTKKAAPGAERPSLVTFGGRQNPTRCPGLKVARMG